MVVPAAERIALPLEEYAADIAGSLKTYSEVTCNYLRFDIDAACDLQETPYASYAAASATRVDINDSPVGYLDIIVFSPYDATGSEGTHKMDELTADNYTLRPDIVPISRRMTDSETHMTILAHDLTDDTHYPFAGRLDVLGLRGLRIAKLASAGQSAAEFRRIMDGETAAEPTTTRTVGYRATNSVLGERFFDPQAIVNPYQDIVQVAGFLTVHHRQVYANSSVLSQLMPRTPAEMPGV